jgi:hypothetical protein
VGRSAGDSGRAGGELTPERSEISEPRQGRSYYAPALLLEPYSTECVEEVFSEVRVAPLLYQAAFLCTNRSVVPRRT